MSAGAIGAATASPLSLATASPPPKQANINRSKVPQRGRPRARPTIHMQSSTKAAAASGHVSGSSFSMK